MASQRKSNKQKPSVTHYCGECALGSWDYSHHNRDWQGKPICVVCPHSKYKRVRTEKACAKFMSKR